MKSPTRRSTPVFVLLSAVLVSVLGRDSRAVQCETYGPMATSFRTSQSEFYDQVWSGVARTGTGFAFAWSEGDDVLFRRYDVNLVPLSGDALANETFGFGTQDEPAIGGGTTGNFLVAWSDRNGLDGDQMGVFGRFYDANGMAFGTEFPLSQTTMQSQWRPLIAPAPAGGFAVAWSGDSDGNAWYRRFSATGVPVTNEIRINQYTLDAQVDPAVALGPAGATFAVFVDFSGHSGFSGTDLYGRVFDAAGNALTNEFLIPATWNALDQRTPRVATDGQGHFNVVWQSELVDGSAYGIVARRFDAAGNGLAPEFVVNVTTFSDQIEPRIAMQTDGDFLVSWEDYSTGVARAMCRRFAADGTPKGGESLVNDGPFDVIRPEVWSSGNASLVVFAYQEFGAADLDVRARRFAESATPQIYCTGKLNSLGCLPEIGFSGSASASSATPFDISAINVFNLSPGLLFYGFGSSFTPFSGGTLCVAGARRTQVQIAGGPTSGHTCTGTFHYDFNARIQSGVDPSLTVGRTVSAQYYARDLQDPTGFGTSLTNAVRFTICP